MAARNADANAHAHDRKPRSGGGSIRRVPAGTFRPDFVESGGSRRESERPALVMLLAPVLGLGIWAAILFLLVGWML